MDAALASLSALGQRLVEEDVVIATIDIEVHCQNQSRDQYFAANKTRTNRRRISEIGLAMIDARDLQKAAQSASGIGDRGFNASQYIYAREFGIKDAEHDPKKGKHTYWCGGGSARDFCFGEVDWIYTSDIPKKVTQVIDESAEIDRVWSAGGLSRISTPAEKQTKVVFMFFDKHNDIKWLEENGIVLDNLYPNSEVFDIQAAEIGRLVAGGPRKKCGAAQLFARLGLPTANLHNGGNDAVFELQALIAGLCLTDTQEKQLSDGYTLQPVLPAMWKKDFDWKSGRIGPAVGSDEAEPDANTSGDTELSSGRSDSRSEVVSNGATTNETASNRPAIVQNVNGTPQLAMREPRQQADLPDTPARSITTIVKDDVVSKQASFAMLAALRR